MQSLFKKPIIAVVVAFFLVGVLVFEFVNFPKLVPPQITPIVVTKEIGPTHKVIGRTVEGRAIEAYTYGSGATHLAFVGGVHGGYEWNSVLLAYTLIDYLNANPEIIPKNLTIAVIPSANPDGVYKVVGREGRFSKTDVSTDKATLASGRFNANKVDLNRNFDCKWKPESTWQKKIVSAGSKPFSEPEAEALRSFMIASQPVAVVFWHSQSNGVYASQCQDGILPGTLDAMNIYSLASRYPAIKTFDAYPTTGAADDWLASINIPAITVELQTHETVEWERNLAGIKALFEYYGQGKGKNSF